MRRALVALNLLVAAASAGLLAYTFFARDHLAGLAEEYVVTKTVSYATPAVEEVEAVLNRPEAAMIPAAARDAVRAETDAFRRDPKRYVRELVAMTDGNKIEDLQNAIGRVPLLKRALDALAEQVTALKEQIRVYAEATLASLIRDLRIFAGTNLMGALLAAYLASRAAGQWRWHVLGMSVLLLGTLLLHAYLFIDNLTFFRIVAGVRAGWSYPAFVAITFVYLYWRIGRFVPLAPPAANPSGPQKPAAVG